MLLKRSQLPLRLRSRLQLPIDFCLGPWYVSIIAVAIAVGFFSHRPIRINSHFHPWMTTNKKFLLSRNNFSFCNIFSSVAIKLFWFAFSVCDCRSLLQLLTNSPFVHNALPSVWLTLATTSASAVLLRFGRKWGQEKSETSWELPIGHLAYTLNEMLCVDDSMTVMPIYTVFWGCAFKLNCVPLFVGLQQKQNPKLSWLIEKSCNTFY